MVVFEHGTMMPQPSVTVPLDPYDRRRLALDAEVDLRTLERALAGQVVKPLSARRIRRALAAAGLLDLLPGGAR